MGFEDPNSALTLMVMWLHSVAPVAMCVKGHWSREKDDTSEWQDGSEKIQASNF